MILDLECYIQSIELFYHHNAKFLQFVLKSHYGVWKLCLEDVRNFDEHFIMILTRKLNTPFNINIYFALDFFLAVLQLFKILCQIYFFRLYQLS